MSPHGKDVYAMGDSFPRTRGDEPYVYVPPQSVFVFSPHTRG